MNIESGDHTCTELQRGKDSPTCQKHSELPHRSPSLLAPAKSGNRGNLHPSTAWAPLLEKPWLLAPALAWQPGELAAPSSHYAHANQLLFSISLKAK